MPIVFAAAAVYSIDIRDFSVNSLFFLYSVG